MEAVGKPDALELSVDPKFHDYYTLSPYVFRTRDGYQMLVRLVNRDDDASKKISRIHFARGVDGRTFSIATEPMIDVGAPGADDDAGCEDPTVAHVDGRWSVFYSGYGGPAKRSTMLRAVSDDWSTAQKAGLAFDDPNYENPKEAALVAVPGGFRMFFEYATNGASRIGVAAATALSGPWTFGEALIEPRPGKFDPWHLSPASAVRLDDGTHLLFYNGATKETVWRIGWALLSADATTVLDRCDEPLIGTFDLAPSDTDIAFAASTVVDGPETVSLYYSISDRRLLRYRLRVPGVAGDSSLVDSA